VDPAAKRRVSADGAAQRAADVRISIGVIVEA
jgi:hypothetical protein